MRVGFFLWVFGVFLVVGQAWAKSPYSEFEVTTAELVEIYDLVVPVDCRSRLEFNVLHMKGAVHIPVGTMVKEDIFRVKQYSPGKILLFYCNSHS